MNYQEVLAYLFSQLPMFTRVGAIAFKKDLTNTLRLCELTGNPEKKIITIHVAGTNGKGSTSHMLASVLAAAGYKTGLYTSPHLKDFRERIRINGNMIDEAYVTSFVNRYKNAFDEISPSFFEWSVALAFNYFADEKVDVAVIETGLGGRLDSTNVITPVLSIITNIGWDHMDMLGNTLPEIAFEKAGIIKQNIPVVIGEHQTEIVEVFKHKAMQTSSAIYWSNELVTLSNNKQGTQYWTFDALFADGFSLPGLVCDLVGIYQLRNIQTVLASLHLLKQNGFSVPPESIYKGLQSVTPTTGLMGRWQVLQQQPLVVADTGHNVDGLKYVLQQIAEQHYKKLHMVIGMVRDKDINKVLQLLPKNAIYYFTCANIPRALPANELALQAGKYDLKGHIYQSVEEAKKAALAVAEPDDMVFIGGSTFIVAEAL